MITLPFPVYHGTSSLFLESIKNNGLIKEYVVKNYKALELIEILYDTINNSSIKEKPEWLSPIIGIKSYFREKVEEILEQDSRHYQHSDLYISTSSHWARRYADYESYIESKEPKPRNGLGELLNFCQDLYSLLNKYNVDIDSNTRSKYSNTFKLFEMESKPVVIQINNLPLSKLKSGEKGEPLSKILFSFANEAFLSNFKKDLSEAEKMFMKENDFIDGEKQKKYLDELNDKNHSVNSIIELLKDSNIKEFPEDYNFRIEGDIPYEMIDQIS
jgi:hypothetical protein